MTTPNSQLSMFAEPQPSSGDDLFAGPATGLLVSGIGNPHGPTVNAIVAVGELTVGATLPLLRLMLNPYSQAIEQVGTIAVGEKPQLLGIVPQLFGLRFGCCPSLLLPPTQFTSAEATEVLSEFVRGFEDARDTYTSIQKYYGDPWGRFTAERSAGLMSALKNKTGIATQPLDGKEARDFASLLLSDGHLTRELQAMFDAWLYLTQSSDAKMLISLPFPEFAIVMEHISSSLDVPSAPPPPSRDGLLKRVIRSFRGWGRSARTT